MKLFVTIFEETAEAALQAMWAIDGDHDGVELRAEKFPDIDLHAVRAATAKPIILTHRGSRVLDVRRALEAGIDFVDVEWQEGVVVDVPERTVLSHHDYEDMRDVETIFAAMLARGCAHTKLAATPRDFAGNARLLGLLRGDAREPPHPPSAPSPPSAGEKGDATPGPLLPIATPRPLLPRFLGEKVPLRLRSGQAPADEGAGHALTVIGMGERGLYSRVLAPFLGSELVFVAATNIAAPGQLTLERALTIYGRDPQRAEKVFAIVGNPAGHSLSPSIHNRLFREKRVPAAYTIASIESFSEITDAFLEGEPCGLSVTAPFKEEAFAFAQKNGAEIGSNALRARAVNTLVNLGTRIVADNTDVDGFAALLPKASKAAVVGAGATARAALVALEDAGIPAIVYNRTASKGDAPLEALATFDGDLVINTLPAGVDVQLPKTEHVIEAAYGGGNTGGLALLHAQAQRQHQLFMQVFDGL